jgi:hypothetical protein
MADPIRKYEIGSPVEHRTLSFFAPPETAPSLVAQKFAVPPIPEEPVAEQVDKRAIWIVHGMGQQVPFETLDALAQGVLDAAPSKPNGWEVSLPPRIVSTKFLSPVSPSQTQVVQRVEIKFRKPGPDHKRLELHLYEAYWAPLTEGVAKLPDVLAFLYDGALHGLLNCVRPFRRAMFPDDRSPVSVPPPKVGKVEEGIWTFRIPPIAAFQITAALLVVFALGAINAVIVAASAAKLKFVVFGSWPISEYWDQLTAIATAVTAMALTFGAVLFLAEMSKRENPPEVWKRIVVGLSWVSLTIAAASIAIAAVLMALIPRFPPLGLWIQHGLHYRATQFVATAMILLALLLCAFASRRRASKRAQGEDHRSGLFPLFLFIAGFFLHIALLCLLVVIQYVRFFDPARLPHWQQLAIAFFGSPYWVWPALLAISKLLRDLIVEYPGDVAIYVAPNKLDRFNEARQKIKQLALDSLMPLYAARGASSAVPLYSKVAVMGHSLGSVIAYDTLNKLLTLDQLLDPPIGVADRTGILETFGSPLDKTAFFFSYQGTENFNIREQLAASVQPLILNYASFRKFPWINVYSRSDIICGRLKFYDVNPPGSAFPRAAYPVSNVPDPDAFVPLIAHVEYWRNSTLWNELLARITA